MTTVILIAKTPIAGKVKTRLCPPCTPEEAADIARAALADTIATVVAVNAVRMTIALDGEPGPWIPSQCEVFPQRGGPLEERLAAAFDDVMGSDPAQWGPTVLIGMDTPQVTVHNIAAAFSALEHAPSTLGLTPDGGWWCIGLTAPNPAVFRDVTMSEPTTGMHQLERLQTLGLSPVLLNELADVDFFEDALSVAELVPRSNFANAVNTVRDRVTRTEHGHTGTP